MSIHPISFQEKLYFLKKINDLLEDLSNVNENDILKALECFSNK